jgi:hypothetical protein
MLDKKNPITIWAMYREYRREGRPIPDEILGYFDTCAQELKRISDGYTASKNPTAWEIEFARAMGFRIKGRGNPFVRYELYLRQNEIKLEIVLNRDGRTMSQMYEDLGKRYNLSPERIRSIFSETTKLEKKKPWWNILKKTIKNRS